MKDIIYRIILLTLLCGSVLYLGQQYIGLDEINNPQIIEALIFISLIFLFSILQIKGRMIMMAFIFAILFMYGISLGLDEIINIIICYYEWANDIKICEEYLEVYYGIQIFIVVCISYFISFLVEKSRIMRIITCVAVIVSLGYSVYNRLGISKEGAMLAITFLLVNIVEFVETLWKKERVSVNKKAYIVYLWPVWLVIMLAIYITPAVSKPYDWAAFKQMYYTMNERITELKEKISTKGVEDFDIKMTGFSDSARIDGDISKNSRLVLKVKSNKPLMTNLYLAGITMDEFDGHEWTKSSDNNELLNNIDGVETVYSVLLHDKDNFERYLESADINIEYQHFSSKYYFVPLKLMDMKSDEMVTIDQAKRLTIQNTKKKGYTDTYSLVYYQLNRNIIGELYSNPAKDSDYMWHYVSNKYGLDEKTVDDLKQYQLNVKNQYLKPLNLSPDMAEWIEKVTLNCENDLEKLQAIEYELNQFYYTPTPGKMPEKVKTAEDFLDYFILEKKEGYCTHFATVFTLLARSLGFPARYVQGFCVPMVDKKTCDVTANYAHAWSEVYFEGIGWVPFEPTAGYGIMRYPEWKEKEHVTYDYQSMYDYYANKYKNEVTESLDEEQEPIVIEETDNYYPIIQGMILLIMCLIIIFAADIIISKNRYGRKSYKEKLTWEMNRNLLVLNKLGLSKRDDETLGELSRKFAIWCENNNETLPGFIKDYEAVIYGDAIVTDKMVADSRCERMVLVHYLGRINRIREKYWTWKCSKF